MDLDFLYFAGNTLLNSHSISSLGVKIGTGSVDIVAEGAEPADYKIVSGEKKALAIGGGLAWVCYWSPPVVIKRHL